MHEPDMYSASGSMMVRPHINLLVGEVYGEEAQNFWGTQIELMQSVQVQNTARQKLREDKTLLEAGASLSIYQKPKTSIFQMSVTSTSSVYAQRYLDQVMKEYIAYKKKIREETSDNATATLLHEVARLEKERHELESDLLEFQKKNNVPFLGEQLNLAAQYLGGVNRQLAEVRAEKDLMDSDRVFSLQLVSSSLSLSTASNSQTNQQLASIQVPKNLKIGSDYSGIKNIISTLRLKKEEYPALRPQHPILSAIDADIERNEHLLKIFQEQTKEEIVAYRQSLDKEERGLEKTLKEWESKALEINQREAHGEMLKTNLGRNKELYTILVKQLTEIDVGTRTEQEVLSINETATASPVPIGPNRTRQVVMAGLFGLAMGLVLIFVAERFDDRVKTLEELQEMMPEPVLGQIPMIPVPGEKDAPLVMIDLPPHNSFSEAFRNVRSSLRFSPLANAAKTIGITSAIPGDGKTTCAVNLAICLAQIEKGRTLLIDADMRKMNVHKYFKMENGPGVSEVLSGQERLAKCIIPTDVPNLDILRAGAIPPNPGELILSENFKIMLDEASKMYQRIIIDTSPVLATDDALSLSPVLDGVIFIVKAKQTSLRFVDKSMAMLKQRGTKIFGLVLNQIDSSSARYYYYYYYSNYYQTANPQKQSA